MPSGRIFPSDFGMPLPVAAMAAPDMLPMDPLMEIQDVGLQILSVGVCSR